VVNGREAGAWPNSVYESTGEPEGSYPAGAEIRIVANAAPLWQTFEHWVSTNGAAFAASNSPITTFTMPSNPVTVMAIYRNQTEVEKLAGALTIAGQDLTITGYSPSGVVASATGGVRYGDPVAKLGGSSVGPGQSVGLTTTSFTGSGVLLYWWKSSSESRYDGVRLAVNGVLQGPVHSGKDTQWHLSTNFVTGAASIEWRFVRDTSYFVRDNTILVDRVTWLPSDMLTALGDANFVPNVNDESSGFHGEDGGVAWASDAPGGLSAVRLGRFGYVNNDQLGQLSLRRVGTGILLWTWAACSEADYDSLLFRPDIYTNQWMSGKEEAWFSTGYAVTNILTRTRPDNSQIVHKLNFAYKKDGDTSVLKDNTWLRAVSWTPTILFTLTYGTLNSYTIPPQFLFLQPVLDEALLGFYPQGTIVSVSAPSLSGSAFAYWAGGPNIDTVLGANRYVSSPTFALPGHDFTMTPIYTNLVVSPSPVVPKQSKITNLSVQPPALAAAEAKPGAFASAPASGWVTLTFEGAPDSDYAIVWSPALVGPECVWQPVPASYREVLGDTEDGKRLFRISAEVQAAGPACFFRVEAR
jgi:hypothetical protein